MPISSYVVTGLLAGRRTRRQWLSVDPRCGGDPRRRQLPLLPDHARASLRPRVMSLTVRGGCRDDLDLGRCRARSSAFSAGTFIGRRRGRLGASPATVAGKAADIAVVSRTLPRLADHHLMEVAVLHGHRADIRFQPRQSLRCVPRFCPPHSRVDSTTSGTWVNDDVRGAAAAILEIGFEPCETCSAPKAAAFWPSRNSARCYSDTK
jgi:hypothetical protein